ncbi:TonB-dependent siderophore receptor [Pseudorhodoferax sp.]|uniref:TonB-dependent siderophore receptor n=1 Tax=Pseudorhodoferax sp. TaxID=1993553 RepID=UPI0039E6B58F
MHRSVLARALCAALAALSTTAQAQAPASALPEVRVSATGDDSTEGTGAYATEGATSVGSRLSLTPRETPQSVSVVTRQRMDDFNLQSVEDIAGATTGIYLSKSSTERAGFRSRGFSIGNYVIDGTPLMLNVYGNDTMGQNTLAMYDRVEVLRGATGLLTGTGDPSGVLNLVRKRPTAERHVALEGTLGRWNNKRLELDAGGPLNAAGTLRGRTVLAWQDTDTFAQNYEHRRKLAYGILEADLGPGTRLTLGGSYNDEANPGSSWYGIPYAVNGSALDIPRSFTTVPDWAYWDKKGVQAFAELEHRLRNGWKARLSYLHFDAELDSFVNQYTRIGTTDNFRMAANKFFYEHLNDVVDASVSGPFQLFGRRHELVAGAGWARRTEQNDGYSAPAFSAVFNPITWNPNDTPRPADSLFGYYWGQDITIKRSNVYAATRLSLADGLTAIVGGRLDWYDYTNRNMMTNGVQTYGVDHQATPYAGLVYDLNAQHSVYASVTRVFNPQSALDRNGTLLPPETGTNLEAGIKGEYLGGRLNASAAVFEIRKKNIARSLDAAECNGQLSCSEAAGEIRARGFELEVVGALTPAWNLQAGYSYTGAEYTRSASAATPVGSPYNANVPRRLLRLASTYRLDGALQGWRVGASVQSQSAIDRVSSGVAQHHGGVTIVGLMAGWQATPQLDLRLSVSNLFDKYYYQSFGGFGEPRNWQLSARYTF